MIYKYLLLLLLGHVVGDFYFQTDYISKKKDEKYSGVILHSFEYLLAVVVVMIPVISLDMLLSAIYLSAMHFVIDSVKFYLLKRKIINKSGIVFVFDQCIHVLSVFVLSYVMYKNNFKFTCLPIVHDVFDVFGIEKNLFLRLLLSILLLHKPTNIMIQNLLGGYKPKEDENKLFIRDNKVGRKIGTIERFIMLLFILMNQYAAMGLVLTAKSIARYDKIVKEEKFAEYYLLGTLFSTASVLLCKVMLLL
mgnify:CR=1 FL=1